MKGTMNTMKFLLLLTLATAVMMGTSISSIDNTGTTPQGTIDPNWTINGGTAYTTHISPTIFPGNFWIPDQATSEWISPQPVYQTFPTADPSGLYDFGTTFNLSGDDPLHTSITFMAAADNLLVGVKLNGVSIGGFFPPILDFSFGPATTISSGFVGGLNHLDFIVSNFVLATGNPVGIQVQFQSDTVVNQTTAPTPEPAPVGEMLVGSGFVMLALRRRSKT